MSFEDCSALIISCSEPFLPKGNSTLIYHAKFQTFDGRELVNLIKKLVAIDADWVPKATKDSPSSLYIRPTSIGTDVSKSFMKTVLYEYLLFCGINLMN